MNPRDMVDAVAGAECVAFWATDPPNLAVVLPLGDRQVEITHAHAVLLELAGELVSSPIDTPDGTRLGVMFMPASRDCA